MLQNLSHSQNFINNQNLIHRLISFVDFKLANITLEIGPGKGIITNELLKHEGKRFILIEADQKLFSYLKKKYSGFKNIVLIHEDFLKYSLPKEPFIIVSNIPFNITADIIRKITSEVSSLKAAYLILQKNAALKFIGMPAHGTYLLSHFLHIYFEINSLMDISKSNFTPKPKFDAKFILLKRKSTPSLPPREEEIFKNFLTYLFGISRPLLKDALKNLFTNVQVKRILKNIHKQENIPLRQISFEEWLNIFQIFICYASENSKDIIQNAYRKLLSEQAKLQKIHRTRKY